MTPAVSAWRRAIAMLRSAASIPVTSAPSRAKGSASNPPPQPMSRMERPRKRLGFLGIAAELCRQPVADESDPRPDSADAAADAVGSNFHLVPLRSSRFLLVLFPKFAGFFGAGPSSHAPVSRVRTPTIAHVNDRKSVLAADRFL